jgi:hypothetical protein
MSNPGDGDALSFQKTCFWVQRCTLMMSFYCLRLSILQSCIDHKSYENMGVTDQPVAWSMKKMDIIQDFLQTADDIPFLYHVVKGEPSASDYCILCSSVKR